MVNEKYLVLLGEVQNYKINIVWFSGQYRPVVPGGAGGAMAPPDFDRSVNPISTRGLAGYAHQIILAPRNFQTFLRP